jgi:MFS family permease
VFSLPRAFPDLSNFEIGIVAASYPIAEMLTVVLFGVLADRLGRKPFLSLGLAVSSIVIFMFTLTGNFLALSVIHALQGICAAMVIASSLALVADHALVSLRGRAMGFYDFSNIAGYIVGPALAGILEHSFSIASSFYAASLIAIVGAAVTYLTVREAANRVLHGETDAFATFRLLFSNRKALAMFPVWLAVTTFIGMALTFGPRLIESPIQAGGGFALAAFVLAFSQPLFGFLSDRYGRERVMLFGTFSMLGLFASIIAVVRFGVNVWTAAPFIGVFGLGSFAFAPAALAAVADVAPTHGRGTTMGVYSLVISLGTVVGPLIAGYVLDNYDFTTLLYVSIAIILVALSLTILIARERKPRREI